MSVYTCLYLFSLKEEIKNNNNNSSAEDVEDGVAKFASLVRAGD